MKELVYKNTLKAAEKLFNRFGISRTAMNDVARAAEVSRATIFNNFGNKDGLLKAVLDFRIKEYSREMAIRLKKTENPAESMKTVILERIKMLKTMKFISDKEIASDSKLIDGFMEELNELFFKRAETILGKSGRGVEEVKRLLSTTFFMLKGMEQGLVQQLDKFSLPQAEKDIDFFLNATIGE